MDKERKSGSPGREIAWSDTTGLEIVRTEIAPVRLNVLQDTSDLDTHRKEGHTAGLVVLAAQTLPKALANSC